MGMPGMRSAVLSTIATLTEARFRALVEFCNLNGYRRPFALLDATGGYLDTLPVWSSPRRPGRPSNREALARVHGDLFHGMPPVENGSPDRVECFTNCFTVWGQKGIGALITTDAKSHYETNQLSELGL